MSRPSHDTLSPAYSKNALPWIRYPSASIRSEDDPFYGVRTASPDAIKSDEPELLVSSTRIIRPILIVGGNWSHYDSEKKRPFMGQSGLLLDETLIQVWRYSKFQFSRDDVLLTNLVPARPPGGDMSHYFYSNTEAKQLNATSVRGLYPKPEMLSYISRLYKFIELVNPCLIIGYGEYVLWALGSEEYGTITRHGTKVPTGLLKYRGSELFHKTVTSNTTIPFMPTFHPADVLRNPAWYPLYNHDMVRRASPDRIRHWSGRDVTTAYTIAPTCDAVCEWLNHLLSHADLSEKHNYTSHIVACDIETRNSQIACIGFAHSATTAICIPLLTMRRRTPSSSTHHNQRFYSLDEEYQIANLIRKVLTHPKIKIIGQNFAYDVQYIFNQFFVLPEVAGDTMLKHHVCFPGGGDPLQAQTSGRTSVGSVSITSKSLGFLSSLYCQHHVYWKDDGKTWLDNMDEKQLWTYNCRDACATWEIDQHLDTVLSQLGLQEQYDFQIKQLNKLAIPMMLRGVKINVVQRTRYIMEIASHITEQERDLLLRVPDQLIELPTKTTAVWYNSPKQLADLFYNKLNIPIVRSPTGAPSVGKTALPIIAERQPLVESITKGLGRLRSMNVFLKTFLSAPLDPDQRMRCSFNVAGTETFRWSSSKNAYGRGTNLQNVPKGASASASDEEQGMFPNIRKLFVPDPGYIIVDADLTGADAQVVAWETGEPEWKELLKAGVKLHSIIAKDLYGTDEHPYYDMCKRRIHATNYGGGASTLHATLRGTYGDEYTSIAKEEHFQRYWFNRYPKLHEWHMNVQRSLRDTRTVSNKYGYRVYYTDAISTVFNQALAWIAQSTVALVCVKGGVALTEKYPFVQVLLQVHDSIVFQIPVAYRDQLPAIKETLNSIEVPYPDDPLCIPWDLKTSEISWGDCE